MSFDPLRTTSAETTGRTRADVVPVSAEVFDEYTLVAKLGHGGMAEVFLALSTGAAGFRKLVVIKRLHPHMEEEPQLVEMFLDEARLAARLNHPHVVQTNKVGEYQGSHFMAMEYLEGQSLDRLLRRMSKADKAMPARLAARIVADALEGLNYAHDATDFDGRPLNVVHRDISPHNLFVTYDGTVKILDFGIAKAATQIAETKNGLVKGKFAYIAPEQARGSQVDRRADLWSMGVVLWESLTGKRLFKGPNEVATLNMSLSGDIPLVSEYVSDVPEGVQAIVDKALQRDLAKRYASAAEMKEDLEAWLASTQTRVGRSEIGALVKSLFKDVIDVQRRTVTECLERANVRIASIVTPAPEGAGATPIAVGASGSYSGLMARAPQPPSRVPAIATGVGLVFVGIALAIVLPMLFRGATAAPVAEVVHTPAPVAPSVAAAAPPSAPSPVAVPARVEGAVASPAPPEATPSEGVVEAPVPALRAGDERGGRAPSGRGGRAATRPHESPAQPEATPPPSPPAQEEAFGFLTLDTTPYSNVTLGGRSLGTTPLLRVRLPVGTHALTLNNPEQNLTTTYRVTIAEGETTTRRLGLE